MRVEMQLSHLLVSAVDTVFASLGLWFLFCFFLSFKNWEQRWHLPWNTLQGPEPRARSRKWARGLQSSC